MLEMVLKCCKYRVDFESGRTSTICCVIINWFDLKQMKPTFNVVSLR